MEKPWMEGKSQAATNLWVYHGICEFVLVLKDFERFLEFAVF